MIKLFNGNSQRLDNCYIKRTGVSSLMKARNIAVKTLFRFGHIQGDFKT